MRDLSKISSSAQTCPLPGQTFTLVFPVKAQSRAMGNITDTPIRTQPSFYDKKGDAEKKKKVDPL